MDKNAANADIARWRGVFTNSQTESLYRQQAAVVDSIHTARGLFVLAAANVLFFLGDLEILNDADVLGQFAASRVAFLVLGIVAYFVLKRNSDPDLLDRAILIFAILGTILMTFQLVGYVQHAVPPPPLFDILLIHLIIVLATYLLLANPLILQIIISALLAASFFYVLQFEIPKYDGQIAFAVTFLILVNIIGITTSSRRHELRRQAWWLLNEERAARKRLESEITLRQSLEQELRHMATTDELTEISNRRHFYVRAEAELSRARRYGRNLTVLQFDLDHFKSLNDTYGHPFGDQVLKSVVTAVAGLLRASDMFGRVGGEEFAIALPETEAAFAPEIAERIRQTIEQTDIRFEDIQVPVTASIGVALLGDDDKDIEALIQRADQALYKAKSDGRNKVVLA
jgi:diguanylate cyclase